MRASDLTPRAFRPIAGIAVLALSLTACSKVTAPVRSDAERMSAASAKAADPAPAAANGGGGSFYPLEIGNRWSFDHSFAVYLDPDDGPPGPVVGIEDTRVRDIVCVENLAGRTYAVERHRDGSAPEWWLRQRQDEAGLYELDFDVATPPACTGVTGRRIFDAEAAAARRSEQAWAAIASKLANPAHQAAYRAAWDRLQARASAIRQALGTGPGIPRAAAGGGVEPGEITRLKYPLHPGARWVIRADPRFESVVEGAEALDLAVGHLPAWRIRIENEFLGPADHAHVWYGTSGYLKLVVHFEVEATDPDGRIGVLIVDESEVLTDLALGGGRFSTP